MAFGPAEGGNAMSYWWRSTRIAETVGLRRDLHGDQFRLGM